MGTDFTSTTGCNAAGVILGHYHIGRTPKGQRRAKFSKPNRRTATGEKMSDDDWEANDKEEDNWEEDDAPEKKDADWEDDEGDKQQDAASEDKEWEKESPGKARTVSEVSGATPTPSKAKETLLPPSATGVAGKKTINSLVDYKITNFKDVEGMLNKFLRPKLYPEEGTTGHAKLKAKNAHLKVLSNFCDAKLAQLEMGELEKFQKELTKQIKAKKEEEVKAEKDAVKAEARKVEEEKKAEEERLAKEAAAKGETYINDEDFFAGLE